jgi:hypothetical protein
MSHTYFIKQLIYEKLNFRLRATDVPANRNQAADLRQNRNKMQRTPPDSQARRKTKPDQGAATLSGKNREARA